MSNTDPGDYIYIHTLRAHIGNRIRRPRGVYPVQSSPTFPAFFVPFCVSIRIVYSYAVAVVVCINGQAV